MALHLSDEDGEVFLAGIGRQPGGRTIAAIKRAKTNRPKNPNDYAEKAFEFQCRALRLPEFQTQAKFVTSADPTNNRKRWRLDFLFIEQLVGVEIDGGIWMQGGGAHSHPIDITRNMTKQNDLALIGIHVLRFTPRECTNDKGLIDLAELRRRLAEKMDDLAEKMKQPSIILGH